MMNYRALGRKSRAEEELPPLSLNLIFRLFSYTKPFAWKRNTLFFLVFIRAIQTTLIVFVMGEIISGPIAKGDYGTVMVWSLGFLALCFLTQVVFHFRFRFAQELGEAVVYDLREKVFRHILNMPMAWFNRTRLGTMISRFTSDIEAVRMGVQEVFFFGALQAGQMLVAALLMLYYDWILFSVVLAMAPVLYLLTNYFRKHQSIAARAVQESHSRVTANLAESVNGMRVTQGFARQETNAAHFQTILDEHGENNVNAARTNAIFQPLLHFNSQIFIAILLVFGGWRALSPEMSMELEDLIGFFFLTNLFFSPIQLMSYLYNQAILSMAGAERIFQLLDHEPDWRDEEGVKPISKIEGEIEFRGVEFGYKPETPVLHGIDLKIKPGQTVALVGHTGSGKSTITHLVAKFYLPTAGELLIDGVEIRKISGESLHDQLGIVHQQNFLFSGSVLDNIRLGNPDATEAEVLKTVEYLDCLDIIESLSDGLYTEVGEKGSSLSLGQRQLICFARALLTDPRILVLDEATSSVDSLTEARLQNALNHLLEGRTSIVVAHRLSTIRSADMIVVLDGGKILERGTHEELLKAPTGHYQKLYQQFVEVEKG